MKTLKGKIGGVVIEITAPHISIVSVDAEIYDEINGTLAYRFGIPMSTFDEMELK